MPDGQPDATAAEEGAAPAGGPAAAAAAAAATDGPLQPQPPPPADAPPPPPPGDPPPPPAAAAGGTILVRRDKETVPLGLSIRHDLCLASVDPGSPAAAAGAESWCGAKVVSVNGVLVTSSADVRVASQGQLEVALCFAAPAAGPPLPSPAQTPPRANLADSRTPPPQPLAGAALHSPPPVALDTPVPCANMPPTPPVPPPGGIGLTPRAAERDPLAGSGLSVGGLSAALSQQSFGVGGAEVASQTGQSQHSRQTPPPGVVPLDEPGDAAHGPYGSGATPSVPPPPPPAPPEPEGGTKSPEGASEPPAAAESPPLNGAPAAAGEERNGRAIRVGLSDDGPSSGPSSPVSPFRRKSRAVSVASARSRWDLAIAKQLEQRMDEKLKEDEEKVTQRLAEASGWAGLRGVYSTASLCQVIQENLIILFIAVLVTAAVATPLLISLSSAPWGPPEYQAGNGEVRVTITSTTRTQWEMSGWVVALCLQAALTFCSLPIDAWRWLVSVKLVFAAVLILWIEGRQVSGWRSREEQYPGVLVIFVGAALDICYLGALRKKRCLLLAMQIVLVSAYATAVYLFLLVFAEAVPALKMLYRVVVLPAMHLCVHTLVSAAGRQYSCADSACHAAVFSSAVSAVTALAGRAMVNRSSGWAQWTMIGLFLAPQAALRATILRRAQAVDLLVISHVPGLQKPPEDREKWLAAEAFTDAVATENVFDIWLESSAVVASTLLVAVGWDSSRYFFDFGYSVHGKPDGVLAAVCLVQLLGELFVNTVTGPIVRSGQFFYDPRLPLLEHLFRFASKPRIVGVVLASTLFVVHGCAIVQQILMYVRECAGALPAGSHSNCSHSLGGSMVFPEDNKLFCCSWEGTYLEAIHIYYP
eukprot:TRINITY_DN7589_c0_g1_i1.p1 TRINITY_DN7589_c0_g1~~TRINITY_DN7589_c0_g1_i1.p1  ORF type:complete len:872 (+),score=214.10 TRINITY_DN7589_c0_g1_i1:87-2702(+)